MNRGDTVTVQDVRGRFIRRVVWQPFGTKIVVCSPGDYENWRQTGSEPKLAGFSYEDIRPDLSRG